MYEVEFYKDRKERCFTIEFLDELQTKIRAKVVKWIEKLEKEGPRKEVDVIMKGTVKFKDYLKEELKDPEFREAFDEEEVYASLAIQIAKIRQKKKLTQKELAKRLHTTQQTISRLENIHNKSYSLQTLIKLARILDKRVSVEFRDVVKK